MNDGPLFPPDPEEPSKIPPIPEEPEEDLISSEEFLESVRRMTRDLRRASVTLSEREARFLVDAYYAMQTDRIRAEHQARTLASFAEPHAILNWLLAQRSTLEVQIAGALDVYSGGLEIGRWARSQIGIGPIIAAGLAAHIDITKAPTAGHLWRYAGLDPTRQWISRADADRIVSEVLESLPRGAVRGHLSDEAIAAVALRCQVREENFRRLLRDRKTGEVNTTRNTVVRAVAKRPWNGSLKRLCCVPGTVITTRSGPKIIERVALGDEVLTHKGRWRRVTNATWSNYDGNVVTLRAHGLAGNGPSITPNHPVLVKQMRVYKWEENDGRQRFRANPRQRRVTQIDDGTWAEVQLMIDAGESGADIARTTGVSQSMVSKIRHGYERQPIADPISWTRADAVSPGWKLFSPTPPLGSTIPRIALDEADRTAFFERVMAETREPIPSTAVAEWSDEGAWHTARDYIVNHYSGPVFNLEVEEDHSYCANGIAVHNCFLIGESFVKVSGNPNAVYGQAYVVRKQRETAKNERGEYAAQAAHALATKNWRADTGARLAYESGRLPPGHIHMRSKRWAVKLFLSHYQYVMHEIRYRVPPPKPHILERDPILHTHFVAPPGWDGPAPMNESTIATEQPLVERAPADKSTPAATDESTKGRQQPGVNESTIGRQQSRKTRAPKLQTAKRKPAAAKMGKSTSKRTSAASRKHKAAPKRKPSR